jgi:hypothetical protein
MDAAARAGQLRAELLRFGAVEGVVGCQVVGAPAPATALGAGFGQATGAEEVIGQLLLARIIEPTSKLDILVKPVHVIVPMLG